MSLNKLRASTFKDNTIKINIIDPETGDKMIGTDGAAAYIEVKSSESREWKDQIEESAKYAKKKKNNNPNIDSARKNDCRALAAVTVAANLPDIITFKNTDIKTTQEADQVRSKLKDFYFDAFDLFTSDALDTVSKSENFMMKHEKDSSITSLTEGGVTLTT